MEWLDYMDKLYKKRVICKMITGSIILDILLMMGIGILLAFIFAIIKLITYKRPGR